MSLTPLQEGLSYYRRRSRYLSAVGIAYYGLIILMALVTANIEGGAAIKQAIMEEAFRGIREMFPGLLEAYMADPPLAVAYTFSVNFLLGAVVTITVPGLLLFFLAPAMALLRAALWGVILSPASLLAALAVPTLMLEGLGYVLAAVPSAYLGLSWLCPERAFPGLDLSRLEALRREAPDAAKAYLWVAIVLLIAAMVEVGTVTIALLLRPI
ncbi:TPA: hypothetical protein EYP44_01250 [Candidatus Bathyarchaeota archaeon]|nr:hypothetical protein [Candidatus Bathyarchaeota archaeon]